MDRHGDVAQLASLRSPITGAAAGTAILPGLGVVLAYASMAQGGFYPSQAMLSVAALAVVAALAGPMRWGDARPVLLAFTLLGGSLVASAGWNGAWGSLPVPLATLFVGAGGFGLARAAARRGDGRSLLAILASVGVVVAATGIVGLAVHVEPFGMWATELWRAGTSLTYANAGGALLALAIPAAGVLLVRRETLLVRLAAVALIVGMFATLSRGAFLGLITGILVTVILGGRAAVGALARPALVSIPAMAGLVPSIIGDVAHPIPAIAGLAATLALAAAPLPPLSTWARLAVATGLIAAVVMGARVGALDELRASRLSSSIEYRPAQWSAAVAVGNAHPLLGVGVNRFGAGSSLFAHNEYLQAYAETGTVGLAAIATAIALCAAWLWRRRPHGPERVLWAVGAGACASFLAQSSVDFLWRFPVLVLVVFVWLGVAGTRPERGRG